MTTSNFWDLLAAATWPAAIVLLLVFYRGHLSRLIEAFTEKFETATEVKLGTIELKSVVLDVGELPDVSIEGNDYSRRAATQAERDARYDIYNKTRSLMLAHRIRPSPKKGQKFDISIFLVRKTSKHNTTGRFNDIAFVEYYLGHYFGQKPHGDTFVVRTPENGFAMTTSAYGSPLCVARIHFHDGEVAETSRYLDFEMAQVFGQSPEVKT